MIFHTSTSSKVTFLQGRKLITHILFQARRFHGLFSSSVFQSLDPNNTLTLDHRVIKHLAFKFGCAVKRVQKMLL